MTRDDKPYFEKVYFLNELPEIVNRYGLPADDTPETFDKYWAGDFEKYSEVQVWDDAVVEPHRQHWLSLASLG